MPGKSYMGSSRGSFSMMERRPRAPVLRWIALLGDRMQRLVGELKGHALHLEQALILLQQSVARLGQDFNQRVLVQVAQRGDHRQPADEFRDQAELQQVLRFDLAQDLAHLAFVGVAHVGAEADRRALPARR